VEAPEVRYAKSGDVSIAYAVVGDGPFDVVFVSGWVLTNFGPAWEGTSRELYEGIGSFARLILFDKRGTGLSDRAVGVPDLETRMDDVRAVMDAVGSKRAAIMGFSEGGPMAALFAATYPERTAAVILYGTLPTFHRADDTRGRCRWTSSCDTTSKRPRGSGRRSGSTSACRDSHLAPPPTKRRGGGGGPGSRRARARAPCMRSGP